MKGENFTLVFPKRDASMQNFHSLFPGGLTDCKREKNPERSGIYAPTGDMTPVRLLVQVRLHGCIAFRIFFFTNKSFSSDTPDNPALICDLFRSYCKDR